MTLTNQQIKKAHKLIKEWQKRKTWGNDFTGPFTSPEEDEVMRFLISIFGDK